jgi:NodT family efflux transporter outer membrane factor (OMF) lipoprotein
MKSIWRGPLLETMTMQTYALKPLFPVALALLITGCAVGPSYQRPTTPEVTVYKEAGDWVAAQPADALERGPWWQLFNDPVLNELAARVEVSNQNVAAAAAAYAQARALVAEQRAALFPSVTLNAGASRSGNGGGAGNATTTASNSNRSSGNYQASLGTAWEPDVWGRLQSVANGAAATAAASAADLATAKLSAQGELAVNYLSLRQQDAQKALLASTLAGYARALEIAQNRYAAGIAAKTDVLQAQTQLANAQADQASVQRTRAQLEHAIAVLVGQAPGNFTLAAAPDWKPTVPSVPVGVPSTLLQRRPDIAAAERRMASANQQIGVAKAAYYPSLSLNASVGTAASRVPDLFSAPAALWALGLSAAQVLFKGGALDARLDGATAAYNQTVARYRQVVLSAFQNVEDQLSAARVLQLQQALRAQASSAADQVEQQVLNRYRSGQVSYSEVITAQTTALNARRALVQATADRQTTAVALIQSLGGGWNP